MAEDLNIIGQLKFASQHLFNLILFCALLYYLLRKPVSTFFSSRSIANKTRKDTLDTIQLESIRLKSDIEYEVLNKSIELAQYEIKNDIDEEKDKVLISSFLQEVKQNVISNS